MKKDFALARRTELFDERDGMAARGRLGRLVGQLFLLGAASSVGMEMILRAFGGGALPPLTLRSLLDIASIAQLPAPIRVVADLHLWIAFLIAAVIFHVASACQSSKDKPRQ